MASFRQRMNHVPHIEPTGDEAFGPEAQTRPAARAAAE